MPEYDNTNRGSLWKNDKKATEKHPDFTGSIDIEGVEYWLSGWKRGEGENPKAPALKVAVTKKEPKPAAASAPATNADDFDNIPFARPHDEYFG